MLDMVALRYGRRPSEIIDPSGTLDEVTRYSIDVAVALRTKIEESNAIKAAYDKDNDAENDMVDNIHKKETPQERKRREKVAGQNKFSIEGGRLIGGIKGEIGKFDPSLVDEYQRLGGILPKAGERDDRVARMLEAQRIETERKREEDLRKDQETRERREAKRLAQER